MRKSKFCSNKSHVYVSDNMTGKMLGVPVIGTSLWNNDYCLKHRHSMNDNLICSHCFADSTLSHYSNVHKALTENEFLKERVLSFDELPIFKDNVSIVRFESFGDIETPIQVVNYFNIAKINPNVKFALWTKNAFILYEAFKKYNLKKLSNMTLVFSCPVINKSCIKPPLFDKVFTVYNSDYIEQNNITPNCDKRSCLNCKRCYTRRTSDFVIEVLK